MNHDSFREQLALRLYGELDDAERRDLDRHLASCAACASFAAELERGLGRLIAKPAAEDLPAGWNERLRQLGASSSHAPSSARWLVVGAALGIAAGLALAWGIVGQRSTTREGTKTFVASNAVEHAARAEFDLDQPPPRARDGGELARMARYLRR